ncbi:MAG: winged helix-turn-helix domain-containing protein [Bacteroidales bacterium]|nr:winged helix-turn-helix domain-containing protein [Bacteroidales bacterium]
MHTLQNNRRVRCVLRPYVSWDYYNGVNGDAGGSENGLVNGPVNTLGCSLKDVYFIVLKNPGIKIRQIAEKRRRSESTIKKQLTKLRKMNFI